MGKFAAIEGTTRELKPDRIQEYTRYHRSLSENPAFAMEPAYLEFLSENYGGRLANCWIREHSGAEVQVDWLMNFETLNTIRNPKPSWRPCSLDSHLDYSLYYLESSMANWQEHPALIPFAALDSEESNEFDMLCLDYSTTPPRVVHYRIHELPDQEVNVIAPSFSAWLELAYSQTENNIE